MSERLDDFLNLFREREIEDAKRIIGPGPFFCSHCGTQLIEGGHMMSKFFMCPNAGEFTINHGSTSRVEVNGTSYLVADRDASEEGVTREKGYYEMARDAHKRAAAWKERDQSDQAVATSELKESNDRREGRASRG